MKYTTLLKVGILLALLGIADSGYLTYEHFSNSIPPCSDSIFVDCGKVLGSEYSMVAGVPLATLGLFHYSALLGVLVFLFKTVQSPHQRLVQRVLVLQGIAGALASTYFVYLMLGVIQAICLYCMVSAINSFVLLPVTLLAYTTYENSRTTLQKKAS